MRVLADENIPKALVNDLREWGHDVRCARTECPGYRDTALLELAETEGRILLTLDRDFLQLAMQRRSPLRVGGVVLLRVHPATVAKVRPLVQAFVDAGPVWAGHISVVTGTSAHMGVFRQTMRP